MAFYLAIWPSIYTLDHIQKIFFRVGLVAYCLAMEMNKGNHILFRDWSEKLPIKRSAQMFIKQHGTGNIVGSSIITWQGLCSNLH